MRATTINALQQLAAGRISGTERVDLVASLLRTLTPTERAEAMRAADEAEPNAHVRKALARLKRTDVTEPEPPPEAA